MIFLSEPFNSGTLRIKPPDGAALGVRLRQEGGDCAAFGARRGPHGQGQVKEGMMSIIFISLPSSCLGMLSKTDTHKKGHYLMLRLLSYVDLNLWAKSYYLPIPIRFHTLTVRPPKPGTRLGGSLGRIRSGGTTRRRESLHRRRRRTRRGSARRRGDRGRRSGKRIGKRRMRKRS